MTHDALNQETLPFSNWFPYLKPALVLIAIGFDSGRTDAGQIIQVLPGCIWPIGPTTIFNGAHGWDMGSDNVMLILASKGTM